MHSTTTMNNRLVYQRIVYYLLGFLEILLTFRLIFKLLGANAANSFVSVIYSLTNILIIPFAGIFNTAISQTGSTQFVFEPSTIIAMIVYAVIAYGLVRLIDIRHASNSK